MMNRRTLLRAGFGSALLFALPACGGDDDATASSDEKRDPADPAAATGFAVAQNAFAWDLYREFAAKEGNIFFSPFSIATALAQVTAGAKGDTAAELHRVFHTEALGDDTYAGAGSLEQLLEGAATGDDTFKLNIANSAWAQESFTFEKAYLDTLARDFGSEINVTDFVKDAEKARQEINSWVDEKTEKKIPELFPQGSITDLTRLVLANTIYFNARWETEFHPSSTSEGEFTKADGTKVMAQMMGRRGDIAYAEAPGVKAVELPYKGGRFRMLIMLPDEAAARLFDGAISPQLVDNLLAAMDTGDTLLSLPKFAFEFGQSLKESLMALGVELAFDPVAADLSGMAPAPDLHVSDVFHKAIVRTDERGTEASAATGVVVGVASMPRQFAANHPFVFAIRDSETGAILFSGRVADPVFEV